MDVYLFEKLNLKNGELILIEQQGSYQFTGKYEGEYDNSTMTFKFSNSSTGQIETVDIHTLQQLKVLEC